MRGGDLVTLKGYKDFIGILIELDSAHAKVWWLGDDEPDWTWQTDLEVFSGGDKWMR